MTWLSWHKQSERFASDAHILLRQGDRLRAQDAFEQAARAETKALGDLDPQKTRTLGITVVSAVSLWFKAERHEQAEKLAHVWLGSGMLPPFAVDQLKNILQSIWTIQAMARGGVRFLPGQVLVSIKGGQVVVGGAPLDLIVEKIQTVQAMFYRTVEFLKDLPHRKHGGPSIDIQEACRPWIFQAPPGSYQFAVAIQGPQQKDFFKSDTPDADQVALHFLSILKASVEAPDTALPDLVPRPEYQGTFLALARNLAPTGKNFSQIEVRGVHETKGIVLAPENRKGINRVLKAKRESQERPISSDMPVELHGVLRAVHLDADWLEVLVDGNPLRVKGLSEAVDDVIGPMVNHRVIVQAHRRGMEHQFIDIEPDE